MHYMFLLYNSEASRDAAPAEDVEKCLRQHHAVVEETAKRGILRGASPLQRTSRATTVRMQGDRPLITDGPFAETNEYLAGYYLLDCPDLDTALAHAARVPNVHYASIEVRPVIGL
jgi:hypothetical protein